MYLYLSGIDFASFYEFVYWIFELFRHCGIVFILFKKKIMARVK